MRELKSTDKPEPVEDVAMEAVPAKEEEEEKKAAEPSEKRDDAKMDERDGVTAAVDTAQTSQANDAATTETTATTDDAVAPQALSQQTVQTYRDKVIKLKPDVPTLVLPVEEFGEFDINSVFPDLLAYEPPKPDYNDPYFDEAEYGRIIAITNLSTNKILLKKKPKLSKKRNFDGVQIPIYEKDEEENEVQVLPDKDRYDPNPLLSRKWQIRRPVCIVLCI